MKEGKGPHQGLMREFLNVNHSYSVYVPTCTDILKDSIKQAWLPKGANNVHMYMYMYIQMFIYIYMYRRERERETDVYLCIPICIGKYDMTCRCLQRQEAADFPRILIPPTRLAQAQAQIRKPRGRAVWVACELLNPYLDPKNM